MAQFRTAPIEQVAPKPRMQGPSQRSVMQQQYQQELAAALEQHQALVVTLEPDEKPLTIRLRVKQAAKRLGVEDIVIRHRGDRIIAYAASDQEHAVQRSA